MAKKSITVDSLKKFVRREADRYLKQRNVTSIGIGYKETGGKVTKELCVQFTVGKKVAPEGLAALEAIELPKYVEVDGIQVPTDVLERSFGSEFREVKLEAQLEAAAPRKSAINPIVPGVSIGHPSITAGTVGCVVYDAATGEPYVLSNWHVLHGEAGQIGDSIVQPGRHDDNRVSRNIVGRLVRSHLGLAGDCAIASVEDRRLASEITELGVSVERIGEPELNDKVIKSGRTTAVTHGVVKRVHVTTRIDYGSAGEIEIGCFEIGPDPDRPAANGEISMGGDSGAAWLAVERGKASNVMLGLHFAGEVGDAPEHALACYPAAVFEKLQIRPAPLEAIPEAARGRGYSASFLGIAVPAPQPANNPVRNDLLNDEGRTTFDYTHFSLAMSRSRKFARWVAWNIDGGSLRRLNRNNIAFRKDPNLPADAQIGNELYANNELDRGHVARRADLLWGTVQEARRANVDSFFFTNITPQHASFNQSSAGGIWGQLEDAIFADVDLEDLRISVMGGPIFSDSDPLYRGVRLPKQFWKTLYFREQGATTLTVKAYVVTQADLLNELEALELPEFSVYEVSLARITDLTGLVLPAATEPEAARGGRRTRRRRTESATASPAAVRRIASASEIIGG